MSKIKIDDLPSGSSSVSKTLLPGNQVCTINSIYLEEFKLKPGAYQLFLNMEGPPMGEDFQGFFINKDNPDLGRYEGQIGRVRAHEYPYSDATTKSGVKIERNIEILKFIKNLCTSIDKLDWFNAQNNKHDTIEDFVETFNEEAPFRGVSINFCLAGKKYINKAGYTNYDLFLPKYTKNSHPYELEGVTPSKLIVFNEALHIKESTAKKVDNFTNEDGDVGESSSVPEYNSDLDL